MILFTMSEVEGRQKRWGARRGSREVRGYWGTLESLPIFALKDRGLHLQHAKISSPS